MDSKKFDKLVNLLEHFQAQGISHDPKRGLSHVLEFQDFIGHCTRTELGEFEATMLVQTRRTFFWVCMSCLDMEQAMTIFKYTYAERVTNEFVDAGMKEVDARDNQIAAQERRFDEGKRAYWKRIRKLNNSVEHLERGRKRAHETIIDQNTTIQALRQQLYAAEEKAEKFDRLQMLLTS